MDDLQTARSQINRIDAEMTKLFEERMQAVNTVAAYKKAHGLPVFDAVREKEVIEKNAALLSDASLSPYYRKFIMEAMRVSRQYQSSLLNEGTVGYQGIPGAYSHIALRALFPNRKEKAFGTFEEVFRAVQKGELACGVVPFENSYTGEVGETLDLLFQYHLHIISVYDLKIGHSLLAVKGAALRKIQRVYSHPQALAQCRGYLEANGFEAIPCLNTAIAAKQISEAGDPSLAAIASSQTAALYGLEVLASNISTSPENTTRFIVLSREASGNGNHFSLLFTLDHVAGRLAAVIQVIAKHGFNMECIRSKPIRSLPWQYYFYVELEGDISSDEGQALQKELAENCREVKFLGSYQKD